MPIRLIDETSHQMRKYLAAKSHDKTVFALEIATGLEHGLKTFCYGLVYNNYRFWLTQGS